MADLVRALLGVDVQGLFAPTPDDSLPERLTDWAAQGGYDHLYATGWVNSPDSLWVRRLDYQDGQSGDARTFLSNPWRQLPGLLVFPKTSYLPPKDLLDTMAAAGVSSVDVAG